MSFDGGQQKSPARLWLPGSIKDGLVSTIPAAILDRLIARKKFWQRLGKSYPHRLLIT
jgi:hypothetical protein